MVIGFTSATLFGMLLTGLCTMDIKLRFLHVAILDIGLNFQSFSCPPRYLLTPLLYAARPGCATPSGGFSCSSANTLGLFLMLTSCGTAAMIPRPSNLRTRTTPSLSCSTSASWLTASTCRSLIGLFGGGQNYESCRGPIRVLR